MVIFPSRVKVLLASCMVCVVSVPSIMAQAQTSGSTEAEYSALLERIADQKISIARKEVFVAGQVEKIKKIDDQMKSLDGLKAAVGPMVEKMTAAIATQITSDYPFDREERIARLEKLQGDVKSDSIPVADKFRRALNIYKIEVNYGNGMESYQGDHPKDPSNRTGDDRFKRDEAGKFIRNKSSGERIEIFDGVYLRFGRMSFVYVNEDGSDALRYDLKVSDWVPVASNRAALVRQAVRVSRGEVAPRVVFAPVWPMP